jgi:hypothetical protein
MSIFTADNVVVSGATGSTSQPRVAEWSSNTAYSDGQIVTFNGSQYVARGGVGAGVVPPVEVSSPLTPGAPRWILACRGRSLPTGYNDNTTYYADQVVTFLGGVYILDAPTLPVGTRPTRDKRWTRLSETLTDAESEKVTSADLSGFATNATAAIVSNTDEDPRSPPSPCARHRLGADSTGATLYAAVSSATGDGSAPADCNPTGRQLQRLDAADGDSECERQSSHRLHAQRPGRSADGNV